MDIWHDPLFLAALKKGGAGGTASGDIVTFTAPKAAPLKALTLSIDPVQAGTGDPSPDNVRPISGWDGANLWRTGRNLLRIPNDRTNNDVTFHVNADGSVSLSGTASGNAYAQASSAEKTRIKAGTYTLSGGISTTIRQYITGTYADGSALPDNADSGNGATIVLTKDADVYLQIRVSAGVDTDRITLYPQLELGSTPTAYTPYTGTTIPVTFTEAGTVYGGVWDVIGGVLRVTHAEVDLGTLDWSAWGTVEGLYGANISDMKAPTTADERKTEIICSMYPVAATATMNNNFTDKSCARYQQNVFIRDTGYATADALTAALDGVQFVYPLATPLEYTLTPQQLDTLAGANVVWGDSGAVSLEYAGGGVSTDMMLAAILHEARQ